MIATPLVSIVIPCFNSESFVSQAIQSALEQTYQKTEIILVDNNSSDETFSILKAYAKLFPDKIKVMQESKPGSSAARNRGLAAARGDYIQFLDSDDWLLPDKIKDQVSMTPNGEADLVVGNYCLVVEKRKRKIFGNHNSWIGLITSRLGITSSLLWKRDAVTGVGGFDERWMSSDEYNLLFRMMKQGIRIEYVSSFNTEVLWREESVNKSRDAGKQEAIWRNIFELRFQIKDYLMQEGLLDGDVKFSWEYYMYSHLVHLKYRFPALYQMYMPLVRHNLPWYYSAKPIVSREARVLIQKLFR